MCHPYFVHISCESYHFFTKITVSFFFIAMNNKESRKKRKQGKSPERDHQYDKQVESATRMYSNVSKSGQKKVKLKKSEHNRTGT